jgi:hypothetical protein
MELEQEFVTVKDEVLHRNYVFTIYMSCNLNKKEHLNLCVSRLSTAPGQDTQLASLYRPTDLR